MKQAMDIGRIAIGVFVIVCGLMNLGLFGFEPPQAQGVALQFQIAMHEAGYFLPFITSAFLSAGTCIVLNRFGALATLVLIPISVNILFFHLLPGGANLPVAIVLFCMNGYLLWYYRGSYRSLLKSREGR